MRLRGCSGRVGPGRAVAQAHAGAGWSQEGACMVPMWSTLIGFPYLVVFYVFGVKMCSQCACRSNPATFAP